MTVTQRDFRHADDELRLRIEALEAEVQALQSASSTIAMMFGEALVANQALSTHEVGQMFDAMADHFEKMATVTTDLGGAKAQTAGAIAARLRAHAGVMKNIVEKRI